LVPVEVDVHRADGTTYRGTVYKSANPSQMWARRHLARVEKEVAQPGQKRLDVGQIPGTISPKTLPGSGSGSGSGSGTPTSSRKWVEKLNHLPEQTIDKHYVDVVKNEKGEMLSGKPSPERQKKHDEIRAAFLDHVKSASADRKPVAIFMMGGTASGKSTLTGTLPKDRFVSVDADAVKEHLSEYREAVGASAKNAAHMAHEESSDVAKSIYRDALVQGKNILFDGTGKNADNYIKKIKECQAAGYHVQVVMPDLDVETARARAKSRAEKTGRWVPDGSVGTQDFIGDAYRVIPGNFLKVARVADSASLFNARKTPPRIVWAQDSGKERTYDHKFMEGFPKGEGTGSSRKTPITPRRERMT
jgi:predicted ABC-type ATPase